MQETIKVLQLAPLGAGGVTSLILNIAEQIDRSRVSFDYLTFYNREEFNEKRALQYGAKKYVVPIDRFDNPVPRAVFKFFYAVKIIHGCNPDIIHINASTPYDMLIGISAKIAGTKKVIVHSHSSSMRKSSRGRLLIMNMCKFFLPVFSDLNLACSELAAQHMFPRRTIKGKKYQIIHNGIDTQKYCFSEDTRVKYRKKLQMENMFVIGHIGRFCIAKNHKKLIEIFEQVCVCSSDFRLLLIGNGELEEKVREMVRQKGLSDKVVFYGATSEVPQLLQAMDCFVLPSLYEGLPTVGIEAQAAGLPVIMSDTISREVGITSLAEYCPVDAPAEKWAERILTIREKKIMRKDMSKAIQKAGFDIRDVADQLMHQYTFLVEKSRN